MNIKELLRIPSWQMPSDPVKAVWWFFYWLLQVLVRFFWLPILVMTAFQTWQNWHSSPWSGIVAGIATVLVGLGIWALLYGLLRLIDLATGISRTIAEIQQNISSGGRMYQFDQYRTHQDHGQNGHIVEGTITEPRENPPQQRQDL
jgi:hypothetical protein